MIHVIASIQLQPGTRSAFLAEFHALVPSVLAEEGCLEYGPTVDVATPIGAQSPLREDVVVVVEKWQSIAALEAHLVAPHMQSYRQRVKEMVAGMDLRILAPA